ncbi:hypothetical protein DRO42_00255 [Candidatus Bathyarchaeota archaeon]|nr:MAG: hypothetical protein DRO42_00255 [Candidatus Bathyarchaeota archaeon]
MILVGTCGWSRLYETVPPSKRRGRTTLQAYSDLFPTVEVNSSFYRFHRVDTYRKWRRSVPEDFEFTVKCHRSITHEHMLRPTERALENMARMFEAAEACGARVLLLQTPARLKACEESLKRAEAFFENVNGGAVQLGWETRGASWETAEARRGLREVLERFDVIHVTDPMKVEPVRVGEVAYFRLHGLPGYDLRYSYTNRQLEELRRRLDRFKDAGRVYVFFNNYAMYRDALRFQQLLCEGHPPPTPFGPNAVSWALRAFDGWPSSRDELLERCGRWRCWVAPDRSVPLGEVLRYFEERIYRGLEDVELEARRVWGRTGFPDGREVEEGRGAS